ncbi:hypothetical protein QZH41_014644, partial [Actinostola sp. cb2023]
GKAFHNFGAAIANDLSPNVASDRMFSTTAWLRYNHELWIIDIFDNGEFKSKQIRSHFIVKLSRNIVHVCTFINSFKPEGKHLSLEIQFTTGLVNAINLVTYGEFESIIQVDQGRHVIYDYSG